MSLEDKRQTFVDYNQHNQIEGNNNNGNNNNDNNNLGANLSRG